MKKEMKEQITNHPIIFSMMMMIVTIGITFIPLQNLLVVKFDEMSADFLGGVILQTLASAVLILIINKLGILHMAGFRGRIQKVWLIWPGIVFIWFMSLDWLSGEIVIDTRFPVRILLYVLMYFSTGLFEESLCRGLVYPLMRQKWGSTKRGCLTAVLLSSVLFGSGHLIHFFLGHSCMVATLAQVTYATFIGIFMCAISIRTKSIYPAMILHGMIDIAGDLKMICIGGGIDKSYKTMDIPSAIVLSLILLPLAIYGLFILRNEFKQTEEKRLCEKSI